MTACHSLNGLDDNESWRDVGLLIGGSQTVPVMQHVTSACHHCLQPACLTACPVNAYEKNSITGIVKHLDDQCFGCQYCTLACPYEVPKYHHGKGIVRKCDMCSTRLAVGEAPACVQACPHQAIAIKLVDTRQIIADAETAVFLPGAPDPQITLPSTTYKTSKPFPRNLLPVDYFRVGPQHAHWPLVVMLVLTQLSVGAFTFGMLLDLLLEPRLVAGLQPLLAVNAPGVWLAGAFGECLSFGETTIRISAVLGLGHSWLSREIVAFGIFAALACAYAATVFFAPATNLLLRRWLGWSVVASGVVAVFCSIMIYVFTQRECWSFDRVTSRFVLTSAWLGVAVVWLSLLVLTVVRPSLELSELIQRHGSALCRAVIVIAAIKLLSEVALFRHLLLRHMTPLKRSALLLIGDLSSVALARFATGLLGGLLMPCILLADIGSLSNNDSSVKFLVVTGILFSASLAGELLERVLFFTACAALACPEEFGNAQASSPESNKLLPPVFQLQGPLTEQLLLDLASSAWECCLQNLNPTRWLAGLWFLFDGLLPRHPSTRRQIGRPDTYRRISGKFGDGLPKGWEALSVLRSDRSRDHSLVARNVRTIGADHLGKALQTFVERMKAIQNKHGPHSVAFLGTGQIVSEEMAFLGALAKFGMGMLHGDGNTRQCMATAVTAYKEAFGFDAPPYAYADFEQSDVIVLVGSNLSIAHPILWHRVIRNPHSPQIVVIDPRATETSMTASQHLAIYPKSDLTLLHGVARILSNATRSIERSSTRTPADLMHLPNSCKPTRWNESLAKHASAGRYRTISRKPSAKASECLFGGPWESIRAIKACALLRQLLIWH